MRWVKWILALVPVVGAVGVGASSLGRALPTQPLSSGERLVSNDGTYEVLWTHPEGEIEFGQRFSLELQIQRVDGAPLTASLTVDARMPEHVHGMKREPLIKSLGEGRYEVTGMLFHMPGYWEIYFDLTRGAITERTQVAVDLY